ncbi:FkbM family methyltransferase [Streptomyces massasporeus]|uniref:FkbM family methyltransferase n=1 Tax=Streptomyces massasporeus TaxID=67324 RepID=UPI0033EAEE7C
MRARRTAAVGATLRWNAHRSPFVEDEEAGLRAFVPAGSGCVDAGAEYGLYTWVPAALAGPSARVPSVEPLPGPCRRPRITARLLGARNATVHRAALGDWCGRGRLGLPVRRGRPAHGRAHLTEGAHGPGPGAEFHASRTVVAPVPTLDLPVRESGPARLAFVKFDVEGTGLAVLKGGSATLRRHRPTLLLEIERRRLAKYGVHPADVLRHLRGFGYQAPRRRHGRRVPVSRVTDDCRNHLFTA